MFIPLVNTEEICMKPVPVTVPLTKGPSDAEIITMIAARTPDIISKSIVQLMVHSNQQLYTYETFLYDANSTRTSITLNTTSFVGMGLILNNQEIRKEDFE